MERTTHSLLLTYSLYHIVGVLSRGFVQIALKNIKSVSFNHAPVGEGISPLDNSILSYPKAKIKW